jgi:hypothetical protein
VSDVRDKAGPYSIGSDTWPGLSKLIEECGEVIQVAGKLIAANGDPNHWDGTDLHERLQEELGDLLAAIAFVEQRCGLKRNAIDRRSLTKLLKFNEWHEARR